MQRILPLAARVVVVLASLLVLGAALAQIRFISPFPLSSAVTIGIMALGVAALGAAALAVALAFRPVRLPRSGALGAGLLFLALGMSALGSWHIASGPLPNWLFGGMQWVGAIAGWTLLIFFAGGHRTAGSPASRLRSDARELASIGALLVVAGLVADLGAVWELTGLIGLAWVMGLGLALTVARLAEGYRLGGAEVRRRMQWLVVGVTAAAAVFGVYAGASLAATGLGLSMPHWTGLAEVLAIVAILLGVAAALFAGEERDPLPWLRRTTGYGGLASGALLLFSGLESLLSTALVTMAGLTSGWAAALAGALVAALLAPAHGRITRWMEERGRHPREAGAEPAPA